MATITGLTAERMLAIEAASVVDGDIVGDELFLTKHDGSVVNAGNVRGPLGPEGPRGANLAAVSAVQVSDVGIINQIRAGRQLTPADFTNMGLSVPIALWNLSTLADASGNGRALTNKGAVPFGVGINGAASTAAQFSGAVGQALYISDIGGADPFRIKTGSWGCWLRTAKRGVEQGMLTKFAGGGTASFASRSWSIEVSSGNLTTVVISFDGATNNIVLFGNSDVADDRYHFAVATFDGTTARLYVDGVLEARAFGSGLIFSSSGPLNIGNYGADVAVNGITAVQSYGRVDEAFVTSDVLSEEQIRNLYCASIPHTLGSVPSSFALSVRRRRRGAPLAATDFPAQPLRLYNFTAGALTDQGSNNVPLVPGGGGTISDVSGAAGLATGAKAFAGAHTGLAATDAGLPAGTATRSFGFWGKATGITMAFLGWGNTLSGEILVDISSSGALRSLWGSGDVITGPVINDGQWHYIVGVEDNAAADGVKRKLYVDGRLVGGSTVINSVVLAGANRFRVGSRADGTLPLIGQVDGAFVYAGALTPEQIRKLYDIGSQLLAPAPKAAADHIEASEAGRLLAIFDTIESSDSIDLAVMA